MIDGAFRMSKKALDADFLHDRPATPYQAVVDLWRWANDRERTVMLGGQALTLKRGQLARSQVKLAEAWQRDREWVRATLAKLQAEGLIVFKGTPVATIITVLDYEVYNPCTSSLSRTLSGSESGNLSSMVSRNLSSSESSTEEEEEGTEEEGEARGTASPPPEMTESEVPSEEDIALFAGEFKDLARGIESGIPEVWWRSWYGHMMESQKSFRNWRKTVRQKFLADWMDSTSPGNRKARAGLAPTYSPTGMSPGSGQKNGGGQSVAQAVFEIDRELGRVRAELDTFFAMDAECPPGLRERELVLQKKRAELVG